jgi:membrane-associated PAP2 superfamily phosphatase
MLKHRSMMNQKIYSQTNSAVIQISLTLIALLVTILAFEYTNIDLSVQDLLFNFETKAWLLSRDNAIAKLIFYDGIKLLYILFTVALIVAVTFFYRKEGIARNRSGLLVVCFSIVLIPLLINGLKGQTNVPCPRDIERYGGSYPHATILSGFPADFVQQEIVRCYPAGHASGGFALMSLYFLFREKRHKNTALIAVLTLGWVVGSYKMLIGDHFLSHTVATMLIAWGVVLSINGILVRKELRREHRMLVALTGGLK